MSKAIINGKLYDTEKAEKVDIYRRRVDMGPVLPGSEVHFMPFHTIVIYKTAKGNYFEHDEKTNSITLTNEARVKDTIRKLYPDRYIELFGEVEEA